MSKSGQTFIAATEGTQFTIYAIYKELGIPLTKEQEEFQVYLECMYPAIVEEKSSDGQDKSIDVLY